MIFVNGFDIGIEKREQLNAITSKLADKDSSLWGAAAQSEASIRLNWIDLPESSRDLLPLLDALSAWSREQKHKDFVLCGMGGSSLAPEVIAAVYDKDLSILDSTDPHHVAYILDRDLARTCFVIGSKSGSTIETASQKIAVEVALEKQGLNAKDHIVIVTDPGSPLDIAARKQEYRVINADPNVGGRFSALSAFGLTPAALIGVDVSVLLDDAAEAAKHFTSHDSSVIQVAAALSCPEFSYVGFDNSNPELPGLGDWIEQLIAESTGKDQKGVLPVVITHDSTDLYPVINFNNSGGLSVNGTLGEQFIFWEWVTALVSYLLAVDPFNQPNVTEAKEKTGALLERWASSGVEELAPVYQTENVAVFSPHKLGSLSSYFSAAIAESEGYIALMAYLHRGVDNQIVNLRELVEDAAHKPVTFGWGPRFLHSTGQFHKGGPKVGSFIQITGATEFDWPIAGKAYGFEKLFMAQALGDHEALANRNYPVLRFHLKNRTLGIQELLNAAKKI